MLHPMTHVLGALPYYMMAYNTETGGDTPRRKRLIRPEASETFVLPLRQSFVRDPRVMPGTTRMLCLLAGWAGHGRPIETTLGILGRHLGRSPRQIQRYLKDAAEEGYLYVTKVANRLGYVIGLRIKLNPAAIFAPRKASKKVDAGRQQSEAERAVTDSRAPQGRRNPVTTHLSHTNEKIIFNKGKDDPFTTRLRAMCARNGIPYTED